MDTLRKSLALLAVAALAAAGCILTSGQFVVTYALPDATFSTGGTFQGELVDLNTIAEYNDHKQDLERIEDMALVGDITNNGATAVQAEAWIVPDATTAPTGVDADAVKLWGPITVAAGATVSVDWDASTALFVGRQVLIDEMKGDGIFGLYLAAPSPAYNVSTTNASFIGVISAAK
jgi:hypothetical protein